MLYNFYYMDLNILFHPTFFIFGLLWKTAIWWYPILAVFLLGKVYMRYVRTKWIKNIPWVLLEIKIPKEISKSPMAMEILFSQMYQTAPNALTDIYIKGRTRSWFSLELVSIEGEVHFYIYTEEKFKKLIESGLYSQYPGVEVYEVEDYVYKVPYEMPNSDWDFFGGEFKLTEPNAYPIKTYTDYGLDKDPKEEFKIDPLTSVLEFLGSIGKGEQVWFQIPMMAAQKRVRKPGTFFQYQEWKEVGLAEVKKMSEGEAKTGDQFGNMFKLTPGERVKLEAIEKSLAKYGFDCGYRGMYLAKKDSFVGDNIGRLLGSIKQYGSENLNGFKLGLTTSFDYPWQDFMGIRLARIKRKILQDYRRRDYFYPPAKSNIFILNTEELACLLYTSPSPRDGLLSRMPSSA